MAGGNGLGDGPGRPYIARPDVAAHGNSAQPKGQFRRKLGERCLGAGCAGRRIGDDADPVSAGGLPARQIDHVTKQPSHRGAQHMKNVQGPHNGACRLRTSAR